MIKNQLFVYNIQLFVDINQLFVCRKIQLFVDYIQLVVDNIGCPNMF